MGLAVVIFHHFQNPSPTEALECLGSRVLAAQLGLPEGKADHRSNLRRERLEVFSGLIRSRQGVSGHSSVLYS
jgi:hypothetical protein